MVRESYGGIIGDAPIRAIPFGRVAIVRDSPPAMRLRCNAGGDRMTTRQRSAKPVGKTAGERQRLPAELSQLNLNAAGIDVGATSHFVAVPQDRAEQPVREFEAFTADLYRLADWLAECGVETVVMESTGVYWIPLFGVLEERGFQAMLVDPRRIKNVSGRKTDVLDCQWLQQLHTYGLLSGSLPSRRGDPTSAQLPATAGHAGTVRVPSYPAYAEGADADEREAPARDQQHHRQDRDGHYRGHRGRRTGPPKAGAVPSSWHESRRSHDCQVVAGALAGGAYLRADPGPGAVPVLSR